MEKEKDRTHLVAEDMEKLEKLFLWALEHNVQFSGKESAVIQSAMQEYMEEELVRFADYTFKKALQTDYSKGGLIQYVNDYLKQKSVSSVRNDIK
jgi:hypothetical protein